MPRGLRAMLVADWGIRISVVVFALLAVPFFTPIVGSDQLANFSDYYADIGLSLLCVVALVYRSGKIAHRRERQFWRLLGVAFGCWCAVEIIYVLVPLLLFDVSPIHRDIAADCLLMVFYAAFFLAISRSPHLPARLSAAPSRQRVEILGTLSFSLGLFMYFVIIPSAQNAHEYDTWVSPSMMYTIFDILLLASLLHLRNVCGRPRWRLLYGLLAAYCGMWSGIDLVQLLASAGFIDLRLDVPIGLAAYVPIVLAARISRYALPGNGQDHVRGGELSPSPQQPQFKAPLVLYATALPAVHLSVYLAGFLDVSFEPLRAACVVVFLIILSALAQVQQKLLETERRHAQVAQGRSDRRYRTLFDQCRDAIYVTNDSDEFAHLNDAMLEMTGYRRDEIMLMTGSDLYVDPLRRTRFLDAIAERGSVREFEIKLRTKDGAELDCLETATMLNDADGRVFAYHGIFRDITDRKRMEARYRQSQKMEAVGQLAAGVAHDFNNLLTGITGFVQFAISDLPEDSTIAQDLRKASAGADRAAALTRQLLAFTRQQVMQPVPVRVGVVIEELTSLLRRVIPETSNWKSL